MSATGATSLRGAFFFALFAIVALCCYQLGLCFLHTHFFAVSNAALAGVELVVLGAIAAKIAPGRNVRDIALLFALCAYFLFLWMMRGTVSLDGPRHLAIVFLCLFLGRTLRNDSDANKIVWCISLIVLIFAVWEYFFMDFYARSFNVLGYYVARGHVSEAAAEASSGTLYISGIRHTGRTLFSFLGNRRVSSIFLEPVSLGNFAAVLAMWGMSFDAKDWRKGAGHVACAALFAIACDSRFMSLMIFVFLLVRLLSPAHNRLAILLLPLGAVGALALYAFLEPVTGTRDDLAGRLMISGRSLLDAPAASLFGLEAPGAYFDMGVTYTLQHFGLFLCVLLWFGFVFMRMPDARARRFRAMVAVYIVGLLSVSGTSLYSAKTAGLLWLLMGILTKISSARPPEETASDRADKC